MAEIKSTMDLVMERAARIGKASKEELQQEEARKKGVQAAVDFLEGKLDGLGSTIDDQDQAIQLMVRRGAGESILRNIFLPRDEAQQGRAERAVQGLVELSGGSGEVAAMCQELVTVLGGYQKHREQLQGQLEEQVRVQYEQMAQQSGGMQGRDIKMDATMQQKVQEEWSRIEAELNDQYTKAMEQLKMQIRQRLGL